jgi:hypothetical protein
MNVACAPERIVFMHFLKSPSGHKRLVVIGIQTRPDLLIATVVIPPGAFFMPSRIASRQYADVDAAAENFLQGSLLSAPPGPILYYGYTDPLVKSHFTIRMSGQGRTRMLDGYLEDNDVIEIKLASD